jgi:hypothetical protein
VYPDRNVYNTDNYPNLGVLAEEYPKCLECGKPIKIGRSDRKFCSEGCKNLYHNKSKKGDHQEIKTIDLVLKKNRKILSKLFDPKKDKLVSRETLLKQGFDFKYHTQSITTKMTQNDFTFCYDYGYREVENEKYKIIRSFLT